MHKFHQLAMQNFEIITNILMIYHYEDKKIWILKVDNFIQMMILVEISETIIIKDEFILN